MLECQLETIWIVSVTYSIKPNQASERERKNTNMRRMKRKKRKGRERRDGKVEVG